MEKMLNLNVFEPILNNHRFFYFLTFTINPRKKHSKHSNWWAREEDVDGNVDYIY